MKKFLFLAPIGLILTYYNSEALEVSRVRLISTATATVVKSKSNITNNPENSGREQLIEIPVDALGLTAEKQSELIASENGEISYNLEGSSNSVININFGSEKNKWGQSNSLILELRNSDGKVIKAKLNLSGSKVTFDEKGYAKLQLKIEIPPEEATGNFRETYKANYYIIIQH